MSIGDIHSSDGRLPEGVREGAVLDGKYRIGAILGEGAMGVVVAARHLLLNENVAIKFLVADRWEQGDALERFVQEARAAVRIQSEHVVRVLDVAILDSGVPYIVMEHLDGCDLSKRLRNGGPLPVEQAVDFLLEACEAISESHRIGIVHRDIKPSNLFVLERQGAPPSIKVLDFGISKSTLLVARTVDAEGTLPSAQMTGARAILGSPFYMSPEQMESAKDVDGRTDIWALGITLFELMTGAPPFRGSSLVQVYSKMMARDERAWRAALAGVPDGLDDVVGKCLETDRDRRYATVGDLAKALVPFGSKCAGASLGRIARPDLTDSNAGVERVPSVLARRRASSVSVGRNLLAAVAAGFLGSAIFVLCARAKSGVDGARTETPAAAATFATVSADRRSAVVDPPAPVTIGAAAGPSASPVAIGSAAPALQPRSESHRSTGAPSSSASTAPVASAVPAISSAATTARAVATSAFTPQQVTDLLRTRE